MPKTKIAVLLSILICMSALAQNNRSAVSLTGNDAATCTVPDPCRTFDVAISKTNAGGEVIVLSSAGYGPFTVTKAVSIISPPAYHAALAPTSGDAITINVDNALVVLRGLTLNGSLGGVNGITFTGQTSTASNTTLYVENCVISGFSGSGVNFARNGTLFISDLIARVNHNAIVIDGSPSLPSTAAIDQALMERNSFDGLEVRNATVAIRNSVVALSGSTGLYAIALAGGTTADLSVDNCQANHNFNGITSGGNSGTARVMLSNSVVSLNANIGVIANTNGTVRVSNNTVTGNGTGLLQASSGVFESRGNNTIRGNTTETTGTITTFGPL